MREYNRDGKTVLHSSQIAFWLECPYKKVLSEKHEAPSSKAMIDGKLLEGYVFGFAKEPEEVLAKGKQAKTIKEFKELADSIKPIFKDGEAFITFEYETDDYILTGEADYLTDDIIYDLKNTSTVYNWKNQKNKADFLQAIFYNYILFKSTGRIRPFRYVVVLPDGLVKQIEVNIIDSDFTWLLSIIDRITSEIFHVPNVSYETCLKGKYGQCNYLALCEHGRELVETPEKIDFYLLND